MKIHTSIGYSRGRPRWVQRACLGYHRRRIGGVPISVYCCLPLGCPYRQGPTVNGPRNRNLHLEHDIFCFLGCRVFTGGYKVDKEERRVWGGTSRKEGEVEEGDGTLPKSQGILISWLGDPVHHIWTGKQLAERWRYE
jgi:hypothetical protein